MIESSYNRNFKESHFRQFLSVVPGFYIHKWEMIKGRLMLLIELPEDMHEQMDDENLALTPKESIDIKAFAGKDVSSKVADWRLQFFRKQLYIKTYRMF